MSGVSCEERHEGKEKNKGDYVICSFNKIEEMQLEVVLIIRRVLRV